MSRSSPSWERRSGSANRGLADFGRRTDFADHGTPTRGGSGDSARRLDFAENVFKSAGEASFSAEPTEFTLQRGRQTTSGCFAVVGSLECQIISQLPREVSWPA